MYMVLNLLRKFNKRQKFMPNEQFYPEHSSPGFATPEASTEIILAIRAVRTEN